MKDLMNWHYHQVESPAQIFSSSKHQFKQKHQENSHFGQSSFSTSFSLCVIAGNEF
ncbi:hypothetical protein A33Q_3396 [Indibacter alkaliphilus LW1]|uniref:Uncharacterized protein n=1 Tax=Indibacter alkaliphilus (strain CCUG 57479 / KCTC 22604 / LW1) TaxID=1189612 RepID=S2DT00_INDAL|nr:hypothetical protein A33Q_3396 [Indibacter alkaliphilus LW1]